MQNNIKKEDIRRISNLYKISNQSKYINLSYDDSNNSLIFTSSAYSMIGKNNILRSVVFKELYKFLCNKFNITSLNKENIDKYNINDLFNLKIFHEKNNKYDKNNAALYILAEYKEDIENNILKYIKYNIDLGYIPVMEVNNIDNSSFCFNYEILNLLKNKIINSSNFYIHSFNLYYNKEYDNDINFKKKNELEKVDDNNVFVTINFGIKIETISYEDLIII